MGEPTDPGRSLADILREAGHEPLTKPGRRRRATDPEPVDGADPAAQRRAPADPATGPGQVVYGRRKTDVLHPGTATLADAVASGAVFPAEPTTAAIPGLRPSRKPGVPGAARTGEFPAVTGQQPRTVWTEEQRAAERERRARVAEAEAAAAAAEQHVGGLAAVLAWIRFAGEIVVAAALGVAVYYAFSVLWDVLPYVAVAAAPLAVTGLVAGVGVWRTRQGRGPVGLPLLAVLLFAGTLLVIVPAAGLLAAT